MNRAFARSTATARGLADTRSCSFLGRRIRFPVVRASAALTRMSNLKSSLVDQLVLPTRNTAYTDPHAPLRSLLRT